MQCPTDGATLTMSERSGIEIDYCPTCRGVWLDRGELDKIIERSLVQSPAPAPEPVRAPAPAAPSYDRYDDRGDRDSRGDRDRYDSRDSRDLDSRGYPRKKKKESWLSELFD